MKDLEADEKGDIHVYECIPLSLWVLAKSEEDVRHVHCCNCGTCVTAYAFTADRCKNTGHHILCRNCMKELREAHGRNFKNAGYIRNNKLERVQ
jgi:hypothetical protein